MKIQKKRKSENKKRKEEIFRTQKYQNSINISVRQCQDLANVRVR